MRVRTPWDRINNQWIGKDMTDEAVSAVVDSQVQAEPVQSVDAPVEAVTQEAQDAPQAQEAQAEVKQEKLLSQKEVQRIAAKEKRDGYERGRKAALEELQRQQAEIPAQSTGGSMGGISQMSEEGIRQMIQQEALKMSNYALAQKIEQNYLNKIDQARDKYPDFDEKYEALNIEQHPNLVLWMDGLDNVGDVVYDIASNPEKFASILMLANGGSPKLAQTKLNQLSASIKANEAAKKQPIAPAPLSQIQPSSVGVDGGVNSVSDFRKQKWLRA